MRALIIILLFAISGATMAATGKPIEKFEVGEYAAISSRPNPEHLLIQFIPAFVAILVSAERTYGKPLTKQQVEAIRDNSSVIVSTPEAVKAVEEGRGYNDINPLNCWAEWQLFREQPAE